MTELLTEHLVETETGWWHMVTGTPATELRGLVGRYVGYREHATAPVRRREVPNGLVALIISFGPSIEVLRPSGPVRLTSFLAAVGDRFAETEYLGEQHGIQVDVIPPVAGMILGHRIGELGGQVVDIVEALGPEGRRLLERLLDCPNWTDCFAVLDEFLLARLATAHAPSPAAAWAYRELRRTSGQASIGELAEQLRCSTRYLSAQVRAHVGVGPKTLGRVLRAQHAIRLLSSGGLELPEIAQRCGYADQSHFGRDFRTITGSSPGAWVPDPFEDTWDQRF